MIRLIIGGLVGLLLMALASCGSTAPHEGPAANPVSSPSTALDHSVAWAIRQAKAAARQLPSPPRQNRAVASSSGSEIQMWPDTICSRETTYRRCCGAGSEATSFGAGPDYLEGKMTLTTAAEAHGADWDVTFQVDWENYQHIPLTHRWRLSVHPDGSAQLLEETGDPLPELPV